MADNTKSTGKTAMLSQLKFALMVSIIAGLVAGRAHDKSFEFHKVIGTGVFAFIACLLVIGIGSLFQSTK